MCVDIPTGPGVCLGHEEVALAPGSVFCTADHQKRAWEHDVNSLKEILDSPGGLPGGPGPQEVVVG